MTTCKPCTLREAGDTVAAESLVAIRAQRLALAMLNGATDATSEIATELGGCLDCIARLAATYLGGYAAALSAYAGSPENAAAAIQQGLMRDLDNGNRCGT